MATAPNTGAGGSGAPVGLNLPFVSEGDSIKASDINNLSSAIEKISIGMGAGYEVNTYGRKSTISIEDQTAHYRAPWHCVRSGQKLLINVGNVFINGTTNEFRPLSSYGFRDAGTDKGSIFSGNKVKFEVPGADAADSASIKGSTGILTCNFLQGYYYIEVVYDVFSNLIDNILTFQIKGEAFLRHSATQQGIGQNITFFGITKKNDNVYPVCTVTPNAIIIQGIRSDVFARGADLGGSLPEPPDLPDVELPDIFDHPFKIKLEGNRVQVVPGTVCNILPKYEIVEGQATSKNLWETSPLVCSPSVRPTYVVLKCKPASEYEANGGRFPITATVCLTQNYHPESWDKDDEGCLLLGVIASTWKGVTTTLPSGQLGPVVHQWVPSAKQFVSTSVWAERRKFSNQIASYYFFRV